MTGASTCQNIGAAVHSPFIAGTSNRQNVTPESVSDVDLNEECKFYAQVSFNNILIEYKVSLVNYSSKVSESAIKIHPALFENIIKKINLKLQ